MLGTGAGASPTRLHLWGSAYNAGSSSGEPALRTRSEGARIPGQAALNEAVGFEMQLGWGWKPRLGLQVPTVRRHRKTTVRQEGAG